MSILTSEAAKKITGRLLTIKLAVERINHIKEQDKPSRIKSRVLILGDIDNIKFNRRLTKQVWE